MIGFFFNISDSVRYHAAIKLVNISAIVNENLNEHLKLKILKYVSNTLYICIPCNRIILENWNLIGIICANEYNKLLCCYKSEVRPELNAVYK